MDVIIFSRVAKKLVESGEADHLLPAAQVMPTKAYHEKLVMKLCDIYAKEGEDEFREQFKEHL